MQFLRTRLDGAFVIEPAVHADARGFFLESYSQSAFAAAGLRAAFTQDNHSRSAKGTLRGLHYQLDPMAQGKLVRVVRGAAFDVGVDLRPGSPTRGQWIGETLSADNHRMLYLPPGCAHGFLALEEGTEVLYKVTQPYAPAHERGVVWNDPALAIRWPSLDVPYLIAERDRRFPTLDPVA